MTFWLVFFKSAFFMILFVFLLFFVPTFLWRVYYRFFKGYKKPKKSSYKYIGYGNFFIKLFWDFPRQWAHDRVTFNPESFREYGFNLLCGRQGSGKTITLVYMLLRFQKMYPKLIVKTNMDYKYQDGSIDSWRDITTGSNGVFGEIDVIDEVQNWFSSNQSRDFPPEMLMEITQQRKQRKMILGTSQVFTRVAKPIRENTYLVYCPVTVFGCITFVRKFEPVLNDKGDLKDKHLKGIFFFVHTEEIRNAFDTYKKIEKLAKDGFQPVSRTKSLD